MELRKVQRTGGSTYIISLPRKWVDEQGIKPKDNIAIAFQPDGTLLIDSKFNTPKEKRKKLLIFDKNESHEHLLRKFIGAYLAGYNTIELRTEERMSPELKEAIRKIAFSVIGPQIIDENSKSVTLQDLVETTEMPLDKCVRRMFFIIKGMHQDALIALKEHNLKLARDVIIRDSEVNRLYWLLAKQYSLLLLNPSLGDKLGMGSYQAFPHLLIGRILERIGDHSVKIAECVELLGKEKIPLLLMNKILELSKCAINILELAITAFYKRDYENCNKAIDLIKELSKQRELLMHRILATESKIAVPSAWIVESIERTASYGSDIAELAINYILGVEK